MEPIQPEWSFDQTQTITLLGRKYNVHECIRRAAVLKLPVYQVRVDQLWMGYNAPCDNTLRSFLMHCRQFLDADLSHPILFNENMDLIDGKHRLCKAIFEGREFINYQKFEKDDPSTYDYV